MQSTKNNISNAQNSNVPDNQFHSSRFCPDTIPDCLKQRQQWVVWGKRATPGMDATTTDKQGNVKLDKIPFNPANGGAASSNKPKTWGTFDQAKKAYESGFYNGVGYMFAEGDGLVGIDLDHCIDHSGTPTDQTRDILSHFKNTFIEISPSGDGLHIYCFGLALRCGKGQKNKWIELYGKDIRGKRSNRYFCVTGNQFSDALEIIDGQDALAWLHDEYKEKAISAKKAKKTNVIASPGTQRNQADERQKVEDALRYIDPCDYETWYRVGMALKDGGFDVNLWDSWSSGAISYKAGECHKKWDSFRGGKVGLGTLFEFAKQGGYQFPSNGKHEHSTHKQTCSNQSVGMSDQAASIKWPDNFLNVDNCLVFDTGRIDKSGQPIYKHVYPGVFRPVNINCNKDTGEVWIDIEFDSHRGTKTIPAKQSDLSTKSAIIKALSSKGAYISESNAALCCDFIRAFLATNRNLLPEHFFTEKLGLHGKDAFVLPGTTIGSDNLHYHGELKPDDESIDVDQQIYANAVKTIFGWGQDAWPALLVLGYSLSSPFIKRLGIKRNPIVALTGRSGYGKSTLVRFALSAWGDGTQKPFVIEGSVPTTPIGFAQNIAGLNGLPCFFDEINLADKHRGNVIKWRDATMAFANGQTRLRGNKSNEFQAQGGNSVKGVLFGAGETLPVLEIEGVFNRLLAIDVTANPPLGVQGRIGIWQNPEGHKRAAILEDATDMGSGVLGAQFAEFVLSRWDQFQLSYKQRRSEWGRKFNEHTDGICLCITTLDFLCKMLGISADHCTQAIEDNISQFFTDYQSQDNHPAIAAIEQITGLISSSEEVTRFEDGRNKGLGYFKYGSVPFFWDDGEHYIVPSTSDILKQKVGDIKPFFSKWRDIGFILPGSDGKSTQKKRSKIGTGQARCIVIPKAFLTTDHAPPVPGVSKEVEHGQASKDVAVPPVPPVPPHNIYYVPEGNPSGAFFSQNEFHPQNGGTRGTGGTNMILKEKKWNIGVPHSAPSGTNNDKSHTLQTWLTQIGQNLELQTMGEILDVLDELDQQYRLISENGWEKIVEVMTVYDSGEQAYDKQGFLSKLKRLVW